jgi:hypothetical protein
LGLDTKEPAGARSSLETGRVIVESQKKKKTVRYKSYVADWLDSSIADFLPELPRESEKAAYVLMTCLDSSSDVASLLKKTTGLRAAVNGVKTVKKGAIVPLKLLHKARVRDRLFVGFDEIWFFPTDAIEPKPESA